MIVENLKNIFVLPIIAIIKIYQLLVSPILQTNCRYLPTCSEYAIESLQKHGIILGVFLAVKRVLHCHPLGGSGYDPVPKKIRKES